jgi:hypothetical protein
VKRPAPKPAQRIRFMVTSMTSLSRTRRRSGQIVPLRPGSGLFHDKTRLAANRSLGRSKQVPIS